MTPQPVVPSKLTSMADAITAMRDATCRLAAINQRLMTVLFPDSETSNVAARSDLLRT